MRANDVRSTEPVRHGAYVCLSVPPGARGAAAAADVPALAGRLGLCNEFEPGEEFPPRTIAYLRRGDAAAGVIDDDGLLGADAIVHVASATAGPVADLCAELPRLLGPQTRSRVLAGVVRPMSYTGNAMHNFSYAHRVLPQPGTAAPHAFLVPMSKTAGWWKKDWMERHTYFLPRFDDAGRLLNQGHALAATAGIPHLLRRTYKNATEPAPPGEYDFISYFECAAEAVPIFDEVCAALRDVSKNPEWTFVREGPTWHGHRVATWPELFE